MTDDDSGFWIGNHGKSKCVSQVSINSRGIVNGDYRYELRIKNNAKKPDPRPNVIRQLLCHRELTGDGGRD